MMNCPLVSNQVLRGSRPPHSLVWLLLHWGGILLIIQQTERWFLAPSIMAIEPLTISLFSQTLLLGLLMDGITSLAGVGLGVSLALLVSTACLVPAGHRQPEQWRSAYARRLPLTLLLISILFFLISAMDLAYFRISSHHLNFPFFEYMDDLIQANLAHTDSQASAQTRAELSDTRNWLWYFMEYFLLLGTVLLIWLLSLNTRWLQSLERRPQTPPAQLHTFLLVTPFALGIAALNLPGFPLASTLHMESAAYHRLAENPIFAAAPSLWDFIQSSRGWRPATLSGSMSAAEALAITHQTLGPTACWPSLHYPLVRAPQTAPSIVFPKPMNMIVLFVEGLDRRYLGREIFHSPSTRHTLSFAPSIRLTPFLDSFRQDSVYFEHFFSNGVQTTRGLVATLCSLFPRQGTAIIKTRNTRDYLCLPSLLKQAGFRTAMVVGLENNIPGLTAFLTRNGMAHILEGKEFPAEAERMGIGVTDGALFNILFQQVVDLKKQSRPYFIAALTAGTHHPFSVPLRHPEVQALQDQSDPYLSALRNFDIEFSKFFTNLRRHNLLTDTMIIILGDHGRHEPVGVTEGERVAGHFLAPLFMWMDESLRHQIPIVPHTVTSVASQVDLPPTLLALNGLTPPRSPFAGRDLSCLLVETCLSENVAYLSNMYDDAVGIANHHGIWWYTFNTKMLSHTDLDLQAAVTHPSLVEPDAAQAYRTMIGLYLTFNTLLEHNRIWSWRNLWPFLSPTPLPDSPLPVPEQPSDLLTEPLPMVSTQS